MKQVLFALLFVLLYSCPTIASFLFVGGYADNVTVYSLDETSGDISFVTNASSNPITWLGWYPSATCIYGAAETVNQIKSFNFNNATGDMVVQNSVASSGTGPVSVAVHKSGLVLEADYGNGHVKVYPVQNNCSLGPAIFDQVAGVRAHQVVIVNDYVFVPCLGSDYIAQYIINPMTQQLVANNPPTLNLAAQMGPRHMTFHPTLPYAYLINEFNSSISLLSYNSQQGTLTFVNMYSTLFPEFNGTNSGAEVVVSADGKFLYASNRGNNSIATFSISQNTGALNLLALEYGNGQINFPRSFVISGSGKFMVVANQYGNSITILNVNTATGLLSNKVTISGFSSPAFVGIYSSVPSIITSSTTATTATTVAAVATTMSTSAASSATSASPTITTSSKSTSSTSSASSSSSSATTSSTTSPTSTSISPSSSTTATTTTGASVSGKLELSFIFSMMVVTVVLSV